VISAQFLLRAARVPLSGHRAALYIGGVADGLFGAGGLVARFASDLVARFAIARAPGRVLTEKCPHAA
jgi:hypothetical protein